MPALATPADVLHPAVIATMDHDTFTTMIGRSLGRDAPPGLWDTLTSEPLLTRTRTCLTALRTDLQQQLTQANAQLEQARAESLHRGDQGKAAYRAIKAEQAEWRSRLAGYKRLLEHRLAQVKSKTPPPARQPHAPYGPGQTKPARIHNREALETLARAVTAHRHAVLDGNGDDSDDDTLWDTLTSITAITGDGQALPLTDWLQYLNDARDDGS